MNKKELLPFAVGILLLVVLLYTLDPGKVLELLKKTQPGYLLAALTAYLACEVLSSVTLSILFSKCRMKYLLPCHMCGMLYSALTPGRVGYYYVAYSLSKKTGQPASANAGLLTLMQAVNFLLKVVFSLMGVFYFSMKVIAVEAKYYLILVSIAPIVFVIAIALFLYTDIPFRLIGERGGLLGKIREYVTAMQNAGRSVGTKPLIKIMSISIIGWLTIGLAMYMTAKSLTLDVTYLSCLMMHPLLSAIMFIPVVPAGLGLTETGSALLFRIIGLTEVDGVAFMLLFRAVMIAVDALGVLDMKLMGEK
jgi:hypothetical protein